MHNVKGFDCNDEKEYYDPTLQFTSYSVFQGLQHYSLVDSGFNLTRILTLISDTRLFF